MIGEFSADCAQNLSVDYLWSYAYNNNYSGAWSWQYNEGGNCSDTRAVQNQGMSHIKGFTHNGYIPVTIGEASGIVVNSSLIVLLFSLTLIKLKWI